jgi:hypothetical protein
VVLLENDREVARDEHVGWTGSTDLGHVYRLHVGGILPGANYRLGVKMRCDGGTDSIGSVYLLKR